MVQHPANIYGSEGSVPFDPSVAPTGATNAKMTEQANPADFGAAIGQGVSKVGEAATNTANLYGGMVMETAANQAELGYTKDSRDLQAKYQQYEGLKAEAMRPQYEADLQAIHQQYRGNLPLMAQKMFDSNTIRSLGNQTGEYASYAAGQVKQENLRGNDAIADANAARAGNLATVLNPQQFGEANGNIIHSVNAIADIKGWSSQATGTDPQTGKLTFGDSPEAQATKAQYEQYLGKKQSDLYMNAAKTITDNLGAPAAADLLKAHWNSMPDVAKVAANQYLAPKMVNEDINGAIAAANAQMTANHANNVAANIPASPLSVRNNNPGNLKDSATGQFRVFNTPEEGATAMTADLSAKISGNSPAMEKNFGKGYSPTLSNVITTYAPASENNTKSYIDTVSKETGFPPDHVLTAADAPKLQAAMTKVEAGGSGGNINNKQYANDYDRLLDQRESFINNAVSAVTQKRGTDLGIINATEKQAAANIDAQIKTAKMTLDSDQKNVVDVIGGSLSKGQIPMTIEQLRVLPGMSPLLDKVQREQGEFYDSIPTRIAKAQHADAMQNSPNAYDAIQATLDTNKPYSRQERIEYLSKGLGSENPGYSISQKDYNDAKPAVDLDTGKGVLSDGMKQIAEANGNLDGQGQQRAVQWYNRVMTAWKENQGKEGSSKMSEANFFDTKTNAGFPSMPMPSRIEQLQTQQKAQQKPFDYNAIQKGEKYTAPDGSIRTKQ